METIAKIFQSIKVQSYEAQCKHSLKTVPEAQVSLWNRGWKDNKNQRKREYTVELSLLGISEALPIKSQQLQGLNMSGSRTTTDMPR